MSRWDDLYDRYGETRAEHECRRCGGTFWRGECRCEEGDSDE